MVIKWNGIFEEMKDNTVPIEFYNKRRYPLKIEMT